MFIFTAKLKESLWPIKLGKVFGNNIQCETYSETRANTAGGALRRFQPSRMPCGGKKQVSKMSASHVSKDITWNMGKFVHKDNYYSISNTIKKNSNLISFPQFQVFFFFKF